MADVKKINGYDIKDETARNGLLTKQDKLTSANAGDNITIEEVEGVVKISAEAGLPAGEPNSLYGTDDEGNAVAYKAKDGLVLERPILPDGYTELEYIETQKDDYRIDIIQGEDLDIAVNSTNGWKMMFQQVSQSTGITAVKVKAIAYDDGTEWVKYRVYGVDAEGEEYLYNETLSTSSWQQYWSITITGAVAGDEFEFVRTGFGGQYIDTGVVINSTISYNHDTSRDMNMAGVNLELNYTDYFKTNFGTNTYMKFVAITDGNDNKMFKYGFNGSLNIVASANWIAENYGIVITGDISYAPESAEEAVHTVFVITRDVHSPKFTITTSAYINDREDTNLKIMGANNFYDTGTFCDLNGFENYYGWKFGRSNFNIALPVYKGWNDILISNVGTQSVNHKRCVVNGRELTMQYSGSPYYDQTISLCANHISQYTYNIINMETRLKRTTFVIDDVVAFDGVPAIRNSDGAVGLYDLANNEFKESIGAFPFFAGPVKEYPSIDTKQEEIIGKNIVKGFENDTYVQLTYLESMGGQVLNLGRRAYPPHAYEVCMQVNKGILSEQTLRPVFGVCGHNAGITPNYALRTKNYRLNRAVATGQSSGTTFDVCGINDQWHTIRTAKTATYVDGSWVNGFSSTTDSYIDRPMALFGCNDGTTQDEITSPFFIGKIAYFREISVIGGSNIESIVMEYIPVKRKADGKVGFYCIQTDEFFTNIADSSTDFAEGEIFGTREVEEDTSFVLPAEFITSTIAKNSVNTNSNLSKTGQTVYGQNTKTLGEHDTIIGANAQSNSTTGQNTLVGYNAEASNDKNVCIGRYAQTTGYNTVVIGANSRIDGNCSVSIGNCRGRDSSSAYTIGNYSVSVGYGISSRGSTQSVFIGSNTGLGNLSSGNVTWGVCIGDNAQIEANYSTAIGFQAKNKNVGGVAIGPYTTNNGNYSVSIGNYWSSSEKLVSNYSVAIGFHAGATDATNSVFLGAYSTASSTNLSQLTAVGVGATTNGDNAVAVGYNAASGGAGSVVVGTASSTSNAYSISVGYQAQTTGNYGIAIGYQAQSLAEDSIQLGHGTNSEAHSFYVGFTNGSVKMLDSTFVIPYERLTTATPTDGYCLMYDENSDSLVWGEAGGSYTLPIASSSTLGGIKVGSGLSINSSTGVLSANAQALQPATANRLGGIKVGSGLSVENDGTLSADVQSNNFEDIGGDPYDNQALADALNGLQDNLDTVEADLQSQIDNISSIGEFLAIWDCDTGIARYLNAGFVYPTGGYFIIGSVAAQGQPNYMPDGSTYTGPSTTTTTEDVKVSDMWFYDGTHWIYLANHERQIAVDADLSTTSINPVENRVVTAALDDKQDTLTAGKGIEITDNVISVANDSVGVPQIANVYAKQLNKEEQATARMAKESYLGFYSDICFNLNLSKEQIIDKMDELYIGLERFKRNMVSSGLSDPEDPESDEINYRNIPAFKLQNDHFVHTDRKMYCYRYYNEDYSAGDPRRYTYFYSNNEYSTYQDMLNANPSIYCFYGEFIIGNRASCLNTLRSVGVFTDYEEGDENWERYPDGDIEVFVNVNKDDSIANGYITLSVCRQYIIDGQKEYYWSPDWSDPVTDVYAMTTRKIPTEYTGSLEGVGIVQNLDGYEYVKRPDLNYWTFNFDEYNLSDWIDDMLEPNTLQGAAWGDDSRVISWRCYWLDYPLQPVLLQDCEVKYQGGWIRLKDAIEHGNEDNLPENLTFRYPYNSAEIWLRFSAWQKRCMYNEFKEETKEYLPLTQKQALVFAWEWDQGYSIKNRRAFGRQRNMYSGSSEHTKISEYIQFNLYEPYNVYGGTKSKSTPIQKRITINAQNGSTCIRN